MSYFVIDVEKATIENKDYRRVIYTTEQKNMQLVLMAIPVGEDIELEIHDNVDQFFRVEQGNGELRIGKNEEIRVPIKDGSAMVVQRNTYHRVVNTGKIPLKLYTVYSPAQHRIDKVERFKNEESRKKAVKKVLNFGI